MKTTDFASEPEQEELLGSFTAAMWRCVDTMRRGLSPDRRIAFAETMRAGADAMEDFSDDSDGIDERRRPSLM